MTASVHTTLLPGYNDANTIQLPLIEIDRGITPVQRETRGTVCYSGTSSDAKTRISSQTVRSYRHPTLFYAHFFFLLLLDSLFFSGRRGRDPAKEQDELSLKRNKSRF